MAEKSYFFNDVNDDRVYLAEDFAMFFSTIIANGVFLKPSNNLQVLKNEETPMAITIKPGKAWINGYMYWNPDELVKVLEPAYTNPRIDRIVVRWVSNTRDIKAYVVTGTPAAVPVAPELTRNSDVWELAIADIQVGSGVTTITQANITDVRLSEDLCGVVHALIEQLESSTLFVQFQDAFLSWFDSVKDILDEEAAGNLLNLINANSAAININAGNIEDMQADLSVHTTAISNNAQDIESQALELDNHEILKAGSSALGHIKTNSVDDDGNLVFNYGRYQSAFGLNDAELTGCFEKEGAVKLSNEWGVSSITAGPGYSGYSSINQYYGIRLNMTTLAGKLPKLFYLYFDAATDPKPKVRLKNITTGEAGDWHDSTTLTATATYEFSPDEVGYTSGDSLEIQIKGTGTIYIKYSTTQTITYISSKYAYTDDTFETLAATPSYYPYFAAMFYNVIPNLSGTVEKTVFPIDIIKWGNLKWNQEIQTGSNVVCDILDENNNVLKSGVDSIADLSDINSANYQTLKVRWGLSRTDTSAKPSVSAASVTWEGSGIPLTGELSDGKILSILDGKPVWADGAKIVSGIYTGDGTTERMINLGFTPKAIFLSNPTYTYMRGTASNSGQRFNGSAVSNWTETQYCPNIVENGFLIGGANASLTNQTGIVFAYTAIG